MSQIFVSYAASDRDHVAPLVQVLERLGWTVFWDANIEPGEEWRKVIIKNLNAATCVLVVWTPTSVERPWVLQEAEDGDRRKCLVPITLLGAAPPMGFKHIQAINLASWQGNVEDVQLRRMLLAVAKNASTPNELAKWQHIENSSRREDFEAFMHLFPNGLYKTTADKKLSELGNVGTKLEAQARPNQPTPIQVNTDHEMEQSIWLRLKQERNIQNIERFLVTHPSGQYANEARALVETLWRPIAESRNSIRLGEFIKRHPESRYIREAQALQLWYEAAHSGSLDALEKLFSTFPAFQRTALMKPFDPFAITSKLTEDKVYLSGPTSLHAINTGVLHTLMHAVFRKLFLQRTRKLGYYLGAFPEFDDWEYLDLSSGRIEVTKRYLEAHPNGFLRPLIVAISDWLIAVRTRRQSAMEEFFAKHPQSHSTEAELQEAARELAFQNKKRREFVLFYVGQVIGGLVILMLGCYGAWICWFLMVNTTLEWLVKWSCFVVSLSLIFAAMVAEVMAVIRLFGATKA